MGHFFLIQTNVWSYAKTPAHSLFYPICSTLLALQDLTAKMLQHHPICDVLCAQPYFSFCFKLGIWKDTNNLFHLKNWPLQAKQVRRYHVLKFMITPKCFSLSWGSILSYTYDPNVWNTIVRDEEFKYCIRMKTLLKFVHSENYKFLLHSSMQYLASAQYTHQPSSNLLYLHLYLKYYKKQCFWIYFDLKYKICVLRQNGLWNYSRICLIRHLKGIRKKWRIRQTDELCKQVKTLP